MNSTQKNLIIGQLLTNIARKSIPELTQIHNALPFSQPNQSDSLIAEILVKIFQLSDEHLISLCESEFPVVSLLENRVFFIQQLKLKLQNSFPGTNYHEFFDQSNHNRFNGHLLIQVIDLNEFQSLINYGFLTIVDLHNYNSRILVYLAEKGKLEYFQFLFSHPNQLIHYNVIIADNCKLIRLAAKYDHFELVNWLIEKYNDQSGLQFNLKFCNNFLIRIAATIGNFSFLARLKATNLLSSSDVRSCRDQAVHNAMFNRHTEVARFLERWIQIEIPAYRLPINQPTFLLNPDSDLAYQSSAESETDSDSYFSCESSASESVTTSEQIVLDDFSHLNPVSPSDCQYNGICPICQFLFLYYQNDQSIAETRLSLTPCRHLFHHKCLEYAIRTQTNNLECPICKQLIQTDLTIIQIQSNSTLQHACDLLRNTNSFSLGFGLNVNVASDGIISMNNNENIHTNKS